MAVPADALEFEPPLPSGEAEPFEPSSRAGFPSGLAEDAELPRIRLAPHPRRLRARPLLPTEPALFPWLARRFAPGEATLWTGPRVAVEPILELLYAASARARGQISLLEGANRFHPYRVGELGRSLGVDATETLHRLRLARAFTAYQMVALVEGWAVEVRRHRPTLLVAHDLPALFAADEIEADERAAMLRHVARTLRALAGSVRVPLLITLDAGGFARFPGLADEGPRWCDYLSFVRAPGSLTIRALRDGARLAFVPRPPGQHGIEEFGGASAAEEVIAWGAPPRPTARRSRSG